MKTKKGRGSQKCPPSNPSVQQVADILEACMKGFCAKGDEEFELQTFAAIPGNQTAFVEVQMLASLRYQHQGAKTVLLTPYLQLRNFMVNTMGIKAEALTAPRASFFLHTMGKTKLTSSHQRG